VSSVAGLLVGPAGVCYAERMLAAILAAVLATPQPSATPAPAQLKEIEHVYSSRFCSAFQQNVKYSVEGLLMNDRLFKRTEPVFLAAARDMVTGEQESSFNSMRPAQSNYDNARVHLDMNRLRDFSGSIVHNLQLIDQLLNDASKFPDDASSEEIRELLALRKQLFDLAKAQNAELNILSGTAEQYMLDTLFNKDVSANGLLAANDKAPAKIGTLQGGPIKSKGDAGDPELTQNDLFMSSPMGELYEALVQSEAQEQALEAQFTPQLTQAAQHCKPGPQ